MAIKYLLKIKYSYLTILMICFSNNNTHGTAYHENDTEQFNEDQYDSPMLSNEAPQQNEATSSNSYKTTTSILLPIALSAAVGSSLPKLKKKLFNQGNQEELPIDNNLHRSSTHKRAKSNIEIDKNDFAVQKKEIKKESNEFKTPKNHKKKSSINPSKPHIIVSSHSNVNGHNKTFTTTPYPRSMGYDDISDVTLNTQKLYPQIKNHRNNSLREGLEGYYKESNNYVMPKNENNNYQIPAPTAPIPSPITPYFEPLKNDTNYIRKKPHRRVTPYNINPLIQSQDDLPLFSKSNYGVNNPLPLTTNGAPPSIEEVPMFVPLKKTQSLDDQFIPQNDLIPLGNFNESQDYTVPPSYANDINPQYDNPYKVTENQNNLLNNNSLLESDNNHASSAPPPMSVTELPQSSSNGDENGSPSNSYEIISPKSITEKSEKPEKKKKKGLKILSNKFREKMKNKIKNKLQKEKNKKLIKKEKKLEKEKNESFNDDLSIV